MKEQIVLEINGEEFECEVSFDYIPEVKGRLYGLPENCYPTEPAIFELNTLEFDNLDLSELLGIASVSEHIIKQLEELEG